MRFDYNSYLQKKGNTVQQIGNKTECAMLGFMEGFGVRYEAVRQAARVQRMYLLFHQLFNIFYYILLLKCLTTSYSFTSERKRMSTMVKNEGSVRFFSSPSFLSFILFKKVD